MPYDRQQLAALAFHAALVNGAKDPMAEADELLVGFERFLEAQEHRGPGGFRGPTLDQVELCESAILRGFEGATDDPGRALHALRLVEGELVTVT